MSRENNDLIKFQNGTKTTFTIFSYYITRTVMMNRSMRQQPHRDEKCQLKATHVSSLNDEETLKPQAGCSWSQNNT